MVLDIHKTMGALLTGALALVMALVLTGCGPTQSTIRINEAEVALEKARLNEAEAKAPYEFFGASTYLHKAKEEWGFSDFEAALDYAARAKALAELATIKAKGGDVDLDGVKEAKPKEGAAPMPTGRPALPGAKPKISTDPDADALEGLK